MVACKTLLRQLCSELVSVIVPHTTETHSANLEEIGELSAVVLMDHAIRRGTRVTLDCSQRKLNGIVRSCLCDEHLGFFVEIGLDASSRWSSQWFAPEHLLPPMHEIGARVFTSGAA
jgi:hypothetical protein